MLAALVREAGGRAGQIATPTRLAGGIAAETFCISERFDGCYPAGPSLEAVSVFERCRIEVFMIRLARCNSNQSQRRSTR